MLRAAILERLLVLGADHNRFYVGEVFARIAVRVNDPSEVMALAQLLRDNPDAVPFIRSYLKPHSLPPQVGAALGI